jgi:hypothetical protein
MRPIGGGARFRAPLAWAGGTTAGFVVPPEVLIELGGGSYPKVTATVNGYRFATTIGMREGWHWMSADERAVTGAVFGQMMEVEVELRPGGVAGRVRPGRTRSVTTNRVSRPGTPARPGYPPRRRP